MATMLADNTQIDKRTAMTNLNKRAAFGRPAMTLLGSWEDIGGEGGGGRASTRLRSTNLALYFALVHQTLSFSACMDDS